MTWTLFEIIVGVCLTMAGAAVKIIWAKTEYNTRRITTIETRLAVVQENAVNIYKRLDRIEAKLGKLLEKGDQ